jgi:hypothetical protein
LSTAAAGNVYDGDRNIIRPLDELSTYRTAAEETFNATDMPMRCSVTQQVNESPKRHYLGPESMPSFEEWVLRRPLGRQVFCFCLVCVAFLFFSSRFFEKWCCSLLLVSRCFVLSCFRGRNGRG